MKDIDPRGRTLIEYPNSIICSQCINAMIVDVQDEQDEKGDIHCTCICRIGHKSPVNDECDKFDMGDEE